MPVIVGILAAASLALALMIWRLWWMQVYGDGILWIRHRGGKELTKVKCLTCGGLGVMWLNNGETKVIPPGLRDRRAGQSRSKANPSRSRTAPKSMPLAMPAAVRC